MFEYMLGLIDNLGDAIPDLNERLTGIIEDVVGSYYTLPLSPAIAGHYRQVAEEAAGDIPSLDLLDQVVRTSVSLELDEMKSTAANVARINLLLQARREEHLKG